MKFASISLVALSAVALAAPEPKIRHSGRKSHRPHAVRPHAAGHPARIMGSTDKQGCGPQFGFSDADYENWCHGQFDGNGYVGDDCQCWSGGDRNPQTGSCYWKTGMSDGDYNAWCLGQFGQGAYIGSDCQCWPSSQGGGSHGGDDNGGNSNAGADKCKWKTVQKEVIGKMKVTTTLLLALATLAIATPDPKGRHALHKSSHPHRNSCPHDIARPIATAQDHFMASNMDKQDCGQRFGISSAVYED
ncbi:hypothetical protein BC830DRAFT_1084691 [Chytriomyces sp. MP71]|nr:hypothetical protein BC830DRAFT_1084691 [Chytriomyces sp. MP71]